MSKNIVVVTGSPRSKGNSSMLADAFVEGAEKSGNTVVRFDVGRMRIKGCKACQHCFSHKGECKIDDDMEEIYSALRRADMLVFASPVYWYGLTAQLKAMIDRMYAGTVKPYPITSVALLVTYADSNPDVVAPTIAHFETIARYLGWENKGVISQGEVNDKGDIKGMKSLKDAKELGKSIQ
jgi:multimeric flavodoxin WrbA